MERPDIAAAKARMPGGHMGLGKAIASIEGHLFPGEHVLEIALGSDSERKTNGALVVTNSRVLFVQEGFSGGGSGLQSIALKNIVGVTGTAPYGIWGSITVDHSGGSSSWKMSSGATQGFQKAILYAQSMF